MTIHTSRLDWILPAAAWSLLVGCSGSGPPADHQAAAPQPAVAVPVSSTPENTPTPPPQSTPLGSIGTSGTSGTSGMGGMGAAPSNAPAPIIAMPKIAGPVVARPVVVPPLVEIPLSGKIDRLAVGASGKYLLAAMGADRMVAVIDVAQRLVVKTVPAPGDTVRVAGGATKFVVYSGGQLHRYDFATMEREATVAVGHPVDDIALGCASEGPLLTVAVRDSPHLYSLETLRSAEVDVSHVELRGREADHVTASADGRHFVKWAASLVDTRPNGGVHVWVFDGRRLSFLEGANNSRVHLLSADGRVLNTGEGRHGADGKPAAWGPPSHIGTCVPSATGNYYLRWPTGDESVGGAGPLYLHAGEGEAPLAAVSTIPRPKFPGGRELLVDPLRSMHLLFLPASDAVVTVPESNDRIVVHRVNIDGLLQSAPGDYLFAASTPPAAVKPAGDYAYQVDVKSRRGGVTFELETKPPGMTISPTGLIEWKAPPNRNPFESVTVRFRDAAGNQAVQAFRIRTVAGAADEWRLRDVVRLEGPYDRAFVGGGGRYLVLYFSKTKKIGVVDLVERNVVGYLTLEEEPRIAVGRDKLFVWLPPNWLVRFDLATCNREQATSVNGLGKVHDMVMGSDSAGPILLGHLKPRPTGGGDLPEYLFVDPATLLPGAAKIVASEPNWRPSFTTWHATADGRLFSNAAQPQLIRLVGDTAFVLQPDTFGGGRGRLPDGDGEVLYEYGAVTSDWGKLEEREVPKNFSSDSLFPAVRGPLLLGYQSGFGPGAVAEFRPVPMKVFVRGDGRPQLELLDLTGPLSSVANRPTRRERIVFAPHLKLLATVPDTFDRVVVHRFDFDEEIKRRTDEYLFVYATSPAAAEPGKPWSHQLDVRSRSSELTYRIDRGPSGVAVSPSGLITWTPPADWSGAVQPIVVVVDSKGRSVTYTVRLKAGGSPPPAAAFRMWKSANGEFRIMAALVELRGDLAVLRAADGRTIEIFLDKLSPDDQAQARSAARKP